VVDAAAVKVTAGIFKIPAVPAVIVVIAIAYIVVVKGNYKFTNTLCLLLACFSRLYFSAVKAHPDWTWPSVIFSILMVSR